MRALVLATIVLLGLHGATLAGDPLEELKKTIKQGERSGVDLGTLRALAGFSLR